MLLRHLAFICAALTWAAPAAAALGLTVGDTGVTSLVYGASSLVATPRDGTARLYNYTPRLRSADGTVRVANDAPRVTRGEATQRVSHAYSWGTVDYTYERSHDQLRIAVRVTNTSGELIEAIQLKLMDLTFRTIPNGRIMDAGMFAMGAKWGPLHALPLVADTRQMPPVIFVEFDDGLMAFAVEGDAAAPDAATPTIPFGSSTKLTYPLVVSLTPIQPGGSARTTVTLRFGSMETEASIAADIARGFAESFPFTLQWNDRRPIGALFLATSQAHPEKNPRGWFINAKDVDLTTPEGLARWRTRLMKYADESIAVLRDMDAQGMITWDPEGEEFARAVYYGDPRLAGTLAPETELPGPAGMGALDEYFQKFREAGFRVGIAVRPQRIVFDGHVPSQGMVADPTTELLAKIEYAYARWGCTLFYVDSTYDKQGALTADVFRTIHVQYPGILLLPENETLRYYAYSAPLNSFQHHNVTGTPPSVREVYGDSFSALLATASEEKMRAGHDALVESVRRGDVLIVNGWYRGKQTEFVKSIYREAAAID